MLFGCGIILLKINFSHVYLIHSSQIDNFTRLLTTLIILDLKMDDSNGLFSLIDQLVERAELPTPSQSVEFQRPDQTPHLTLAKKLQLSVQE